MPELFKTSSYEFWLAWRSGGLRLCLLGVCIFRRSLPRYLYRDCD